MSIPAEVRRGGPWGIEAANLTAFEAREIVRTGGRARGQPPAEPVPPIKQSRSSAAEKRDDVDGHPFDRWPISTRRRKRWTKSRAAAEALVAFDADGETVSHSGETARRPRKIRRATPAKAGFPSPCRC